MIIKVMSVIDFSGVTQRTDPIAVIYRHESALLSTGPIRFALYQNFPNPFNPETWLPYDLADDAHVQIIIYNALGERVRTLGLGVRPSGSYITREKAAYWDGRSDSGEWVASGIYFYNLTVNNYAETRKMLIVR